MVRKLYGGKLVGWNEKEEVKTPTRETHIYKEGKLHRIIKSDTPMLEEYQSPAPWLTEKEKRKAIDESKRYRINEEKIEVEKKTRTCKTSEKISNGQISPLL